MEKPIHLPTLTGPQVDAILAGLRMLQKGLDSSGGLPANVEIILTNDSEHEGLRDLNEIDALCERINSGCEKSSALEALIALAECNQLDDNPCDCAALVEAKEKACSALKEAGEVHA
jgi:hypothetical protein